MNSTWRQAPEFRLAIIAVIVFALMGVLSPERFLSAQNLTSMAFQFPEFAILALAMTLAMMTGGIDLSVVGIANLSAVIAALILTEFADPNLSIQASLLFLGFALGVSLLIGAVAGLLNGTLVAFLGLPPILATLGSGLVFTGLAIALTGGLCSDGVSAGCGLEWQYSGAWYPNPSAHFYRASRGFAHSHDTYSLWITNLHVRYQSLGSTICCGGC